MTFGQRLKMLRQERGLSQEEMGRAVGVSSRVIGYYEADERFPKSRETLIAFAEAFSVSLDFLLDNPVKTSETGCPARFCYMKSMNSEQREAVNDFIGYLRYRSRKEEAAAREAEAKVNPYVEADLSPDIVEMLENWYDKDDEEAEDDAPAEELAVEEAAAEEVPDDEAPAEEAPADETPADEPEEVSPDAEDAEDDAEAAADGISDDERRAFASDLHDFLQSLIDEDYAEKYPPDEEEPEAAASPVTDDSFRDALPQVPAPLDRPDELDAPAPGEEVEHIPADDLSDFTFEDPIPDVAVDSTYKMPEGDFRKFFENDFFVDDFFGDDTDDRD